MNHITPSPCKHVLTWRKTIMLAIFLASLAAAPCPASATETVTQTGVASPQSESERNNIEILRERAIRNALDLAIMQVTGAVVSGQRADSLGSKERIVVENGKASETLHQDSRFRHSSISKSTGHVRLKRIIKSWRENDQYYVSIEAEVSDNEELARTAKAGFYWERAGKPDIRLTYRETTNGKDSTEFEAYTKRYVRNNLASNGIHVVNDNHQPVYQINITQEFDTQQLTEYNTYTTNCKLAWQIVDEKQSSTLAEKSLRHGPDAGFTVQQSRDRCLKEIAPDLTEQLIRNLALLFDNQWKNGSDFILVISQLPGDFLDEAIEIIDTTFGVSGHTAEHYQNNRLQLQLSYNGTGTDLVSSITSAFEDRGFRLVTESYDRNDSVRFRWEPVTE